MKKFLLIVVVSLICSSAHALEWAKCLMYLYQDADPMTSWVLVKDQGVTSIADWKLPDPKPTEAELQAVEVEAMAWAKEQKKEKKSKIKDMPAAEKDLIRALIKVLNVRFTGSDKITIPEMEQALKDEIE